MAERKEKIEIEDVKEQKHFKRLLRNASILSECESKVKRKYRLFTCFSPRNTEKNKL